MPVMDEEKKLRKWESETNDYLARYDQIFEEVSKSDLFSKSGRSFSRMDAHNLGEMLDTYKAYENYCIHEVASASDLGTLPSVATDLISATYAVSIAPLIASIQTIPEEQGIVWFKQVTTDAARANRGSATFGRMQLRVLSMVSISMRLKRWRTRSCSPLLLVTEL